MTRVLLSGFTAEASDLSVIKIDRETLRKMLVDARTDVEAAGYDVVEVQITEDHEASAIAFEQALQNNDFDVVLIGNGVRAVATFTELFERLVNLAHVNTPRARFAFNIVPKDTLDAVRRSS